MAGKQTNGNRTVKRRSFLSSLSKPWLVLLLVVVIYLGLSVVKGFFRVKALLAKITATRLEVTVQQKINQQLKEKQVKLEDKEELTKLAREKLGLVKEGEVVYKIIKKEK
jgi:cell division protein FtsB